MESRLNDVLIDRYQDHENAGYPTLCKGRYLVDDVRYHALEEPTSLNTLELLPELLAANIAAVKIEGRQRSPAYVSQVARVWRQAIDRCQADPPPTAPTPPGWRRWARCPRAPKPRWAPITANGSSRRKHEIRTGAGTLLLAKTTSRRSINRRRRAAPTLFISARASAPSGAR